MTLGRQLENMLTEYLVPKSAQKPTDLKSLPTLWSCSNSYSHQAIILSTQLLVHEHIRKSLEVDQSVECIEQILNELKYLESTVHKMVGLNEIQEGSLAPLSNFVRNVGSDSTLPDSTAAFRASESHLASGSGHLSDLTVDTQQQPFDKEGSMVNIRAQNAKLMQNRFLLHKIVSVILSNMAKVKNLMSSNIDKHLLTNWQSSVHYEYHNDTQTCSLNGGGASVPYGLCYTGSVPAVDSPHLQEITEQMLLTMSNHCSGLIYTDQVNLNTACN